jgi:hypothetical protein
MGSTEVSRVGRHREIDFVEQPGNNESNASAVSWAAVVAGGFVTAALSLILLALGTGLGFASVSVWSNISASASAIGAAAILWLIAMQMISSSMGGYLAGRLRTKWASVHTDEVYFRDTAHGFLAWAVAFVITTAFLATAAASMAGTAVQSLSPTVESAREADPAGYFVDTLFRSDGAKSDATAAERGEAGRILANATRQGDIPAADRRYLAQVVVARTGLSLSDADKRLSEVFASSQQTLETTRKVMAHSLLWAFIALLTGAFCSSFAATIGGKQRDHVVTI